MAFPLRRSALPAARDLCTPTVRSVRPVVPLAVSGCRGQSNDRKG